MHFSVLVKMDQEIRNLEEFVRVTFCFHTQRFVFITAVPITKLFAWGEAVIVEDMCYERRRAEACVE